MGSLPTPQNHRILLMVLERRAYCELLPRKHRNRLLDAITLLLSGKAAVESWDEAFSRAPAYPGI